MYAAVVFLLTLPLLGHDSWAVREAAQVEATKYAASGECRGLQVRDLAYGERINDPEVRHRLRAAASAGLRKVLDTLLPADAVLWPDIDHVAGPPPKFNNWNFLTEEEQCALDARNKLLTELRQGYVIIRDDPRRDHTLYADYRYACRAWAVDQLCDARCEAEVEALRVRLAEVVKRDKLRNPADTTPTDSVRFRARIAEIKTYHPGIVNPRFNP